MKLYNQSFEGEIILEFNNYNTFKAAMKDNFPLGLKLKNDYEYSRPSVYLDTKNLDLYKKKASLVIRPTKEKSVGAIIKYGHSSLLRDHLLIRSEQSSLVELADIKSSDFIKHYFNILDIDLSKELLTTLVVIQNRFHKSTIDEENKIHFSFDIVQYYNHMNQHINTSYIMELEITNKEISQLPNVFLNKLAAYYIDKYDAEQFEFDSKYSKGLYLLQ